MRETKNILQPFTIAKICDKCGKRVDFTDTFEFQEFYNIKFEGGFESVFGDGAKIDLDICQNCLYKMLKSIIKK